MRFYTRAVQFFPKSKVCKNEKEHRMHKEENVPGVGNEAAGEESQEIQVSGIDNETRQIFYREVGLLQSNTVISKEKEGE